MPPKQSTTSARGGRSASSAAGRSSKTSKSTSKASTSASTARHSSSRSAQVIHSDNSDVEEEPRRGHGRDDTMDVDGEDEEEDEEEEDEEAARKTIPPELLTRILHQSFEKDGTRVSKDANAAIAKYMDIFVREAIARTVVEKERGFLEVGSLIFVSFPLSPFPSFFLRRSARVTSCADADAYTEHLGRGPRESRAAATT